MIAFLSLLGASCGTGASPAGGDQNLPNAQAGPFRVLRASETAGRAPFVIEKSAPWEAPAALDTDDDPATMGVTFYVSWGTPRSISRFDSSDGLSVKQGATRILQGTDPWEGSTGVAHPTVIRAGAEVWMYYAAAGCIGRAVSTDNGQTFSKPQPQPVLCGAGGPEWEGGAVTAPSVFRGHDGRYHLLYEANGAIGEAVSGDGVSFVRSGGGPLLTAFAAEPLAPGAESDDVFDSAAVGEPFGMIDTSELGRPITLVYYTATNRLGRLAVGLSARFGDEGPLTRNPAPALTRYDAHGPAVLRFGSTSILYAAGRNSEVATGWKSVIVGAVAPADRSLPAPAASSSASP